MFAIKNLFKKKVGADLLKNKDFSVTKESGMNGRTMTEMLGTLAIIGVLSIGGIAGYSYAMDKYRANVTINDINMRAVDLITQAGRGVELSLREWSGTSMAGYTFGNFGKTDDGMIFLEISGIPKGVCNMMVDTLGEQFDMDINGDRIDETDECGLSDNNVITVYIEGDGAGITCDPACPDGKVCEDGLCLSRVVQPGTAGFSCSSDTDCPECYTCSSNQCDFVGLDGTSCSIGTCYQGICKGNGCSSNEGCQSDEYCADTNNSCSSANPSYCRKWDFVSKVIEVGNTSERWYVSRNILSWWDARSACNKIGKTMVTVGELVSGWNGSSDRTFTRTERAQKLYSAIGGGDYHIWTSDNNGSCNAFHVNLSDGYVRNYHRNTFDPYLALCRDPNGADFPSDYSSGGGWIIDEVTSAEVTTGY